MLTRSLLLIVITLSATSACTTMEAAPGLTAPELKMKLQERGVVVQSPARPVALMEKTKAKAIGNMLVASVVSSAVGSSAHAASPQQVQSNMQVSQEFGRQLNQALPAGEAIKKGNGIDVALADRLSAYFSGRNPGSKSTAPLNLSVNAYQWELAYLSLTSSDYALNYRLEILVQEKQKDSLRTLKKLHCQGTSAQKMPLERWQSENYRETSLAAQTIVEDCYKKTLSELGLG